MNPTPARAASDPASVIAGLAQQRFDDFTAAEAAAGFHILRPSGDYPIAAGGKTSARMMGGSLVSMTQYTYPPLAPSSIGVDVAPAPKESRHLLEFERAPERTFGAHTGRLLRDDGTALEFIWYCGGADSPLIWCRVYGSAEIGIDAFGEFVATMR